MCEFCNGDNKEHELLKDDIARLYTKSFNDGAMYIYCQPKNRIISNGLRLNHCIMCGRNLMEE